MIKYLHDQIINRSTDFCLADYLLLDDHISSIKKTHSQNSLNDSMLISTNLNSNDIISNDRTTSQVEKLTTSNNGTNSGLRLNCSLSSSSPIIIPQKPPRSNTSPQSSSSYIYITDHMSSLDETSLKSYRDIDDVSNSLLPMLSSNCQQLEHSAARDRISVKNKRRQPIKQKLNILRETDDNQNNLFLSTSSDQHIINISQNEIKDHSNIDKIQTHIPLSIRPRDHSADNILSTSSIHSTYASSVQRSISFKRPQEIDERKFFNQSIFKKEVEQEEKEEENRNKSITYPSSHEHIYDNLDVFKYYQTNPISNITAQRREHSTTRLRPITMHIPTNNDKQIINEFENVFNQLKQTGSIKKLQPKEDIIFSEESSIPIDETSTILQIENKPIEISSITETPNRRQTVGGIHLQTNNKPTPSWIDIAKQKQNKFQSTSIEKTSHEQPEQHQIQYIEPTIVSKKQVSISYNIGINKDNISDDTHSTKPIIYESVITRRPSTSTNIHVIERDSIRALKAANPNRINNLIQFFDK